MDAVDAIGMALTPGTVFNQQNKVFRSAKALAQFANVDQGEVLALVAENLADRVTIRPSNKRPENGPLIALTEFIPLQQENAVQVQIVGGNAVEPDGLGVQGAAGFGKLPIPHEPNDGAQALMAKVAAIANEEQVLEEDDDPMDVAEVVMGANAPDDE